MASCVSEKRLLVGFDDIGIPDWTQVEFLAFSRDVKVCSMCGVVSAVVANVACKHVFCSFCFREQGDGSTLSCPIDKVETKPGKIRFERNSTELLLSLRVACVNRRNGCRLLETLRAMKDHFKQCEFQVVQCQMCGKKIKLLDVPLHARKDCCRHRNPDSTNKPLTYPTQPPVTPVLPVPPPSVMQHQTYHVTAVPFVSHPSSTVQMPTVHVTQPALPPAATTSANAVPVIPAANEVTLLQQKIGKVHEDVRKTSAKVQTLRDETARELESFKKELQKLKSEKDDYTGVVCAISGLKNQMKGNMAIISEEFEAIKEDMKNYESNIESVSLLKEAVKTKLGDVVGDVEELKKSADSYAELGDAVSELKLSVGVIHDMKYVMEFVTEFEQTLVGDVKGSSGDKKKAFTQQIETLKKCVEVIDELKTSVKRQDVEQLANELQVIKEDMRRYTALERKLEGFSTDLTDLRQAVKEAGDAARSEITSISEQHFAELEKAKDGVKLIDEKLSRISSDVESMKSAAASEAKDKVTLDEVVNEVTKLKTKLQDLDTLEECLQETKEDAFAKIAALNAEVTEMTDKKARESSDLTVSNENREKRLQEIVTELATLRPIADDVQRLQLNLETASDKFDSKLEALRASLENSISEKIGGANTAQNVIDIQTMLADVKRDIHVLNELKESFATRDAIVKESVSDAVKEVRALKVTVDSLQDASMTAREKLKRCEELKASLDIIKDNIRDYDEFKQSVSSLRKAMEDSVSKPPAEVAVD